MCRHIPSCSLDAVVEDAVNSVGVDVNTASVPLLERVDHPVATNPDARLRALATERGWPILDLFAPETP